MLKFGAKGEKVVQRVRIYNGESGEIRLYLTDTHELHIEDNLHNDYNIITNYKVQQIVKFSDTLAAILSVSGDLAFFGEFDPIFKGIVTRMDEKHNIPNKAAVFNIDPRLKFMQGIKKLAVFNGNLYILKYNGNLCAIGPNKVIALNGLPLKEDYYGITSDIQCLNSKVIDIHVNNANSMYLIVNTDNPYPYDDGLYTANNDIYVYKYDHIDVDNMRIEKMNKDDSVIIDCKSSFVNIKSKYNNPIIVGHGNIYAATDNSYFRLENFYPGKVQYILPWYADAKSFKSMVNVYINHRFGMLTMSTLEFTSIILDLLSRKNKEEFKNFIEEKIGEEQSKKKAPPKKAKAKKDETAKEEEVKE